MGNYEIDHAEDGDLNKKTNSHQQSSTYQEKYSEKLKELNEGYLKIESALSVLCGSGQVICAEGEQSVCYGHSSTLGLDFDSFGMVMENSLPVCMKNDQISRTHPSCLNNTVPVCGIKNNISSVLSEGQVVCPTSGTSGVICPFGGNPVCVVTKSKEKKAYCVSSSHALISTSDQYEKSYNISCNDGVSKPYCISYIPKPEVPPTTNAEPY